MKSMLGKDPRFLLASEFLISADKDYCRPTAIDDFRRAWGDRFVYFHGAVSDRNFGRPTVQLEVNRNYLVRLFDLTEEVAVSQCLEFLKQDNALLVGAPGLLLLWHLRLWDFYLDGGGKVFSLDHPERLWQDHNQQPRLPFIFHRADNEWILGLERFEEPLPPESRLIGFYDLASLDSVRTNEEGGADLAGTVIDAPFIIIATPTITTVEGDNHDR